MTATPARPWLRSTTSCAIRQSARRTSSASRTWEWAEKTPPSGGVDFRSRWAMLYLARRSGLTGPTSRTRPTLPMSRHLATTARRSDRPETPRSRQRADQQHQRRDRRQSEDQRADAALVDTATQRRRREEAA